jgi:hypothetical protein
MPATPAGLIFIHSASESLFTSAWERLFAFPGIPTFAGTSTQAIGNNETVEPSVAHQNHSIRPGPEVFRSVRRMGILQLRPCPRLPLGRGTAPNKN